MADVIARQFTPAFLFITPKQPTVLDAISVQAPVSRVSAGIQLLPAIVITEAHVTAAIPSTIEIQLTARAATVDISVVASIAVPRRFRRSAWQARLGNKLDPIKRKFIDNSILLTSHPTDMLRIRVSRDARTHDILSRKIISNEILPIVLPIMENVPMRRLIRDDYNVLSLAVTDIDNAKPFEIYCPGAGQLQRDDLLFRFIGDTYSELPYVLVLQVKDELGTIGYSSLLQVKYSATLYDEALPSSVVNAVYAANLKRGRLRW